MLNTIHITENAAAKVLELIQEDGNLQMNLRVFVTGGGCSGFQYGFLFEEGTQEGDTVVTKTMESGSMCLLVDAVSLQYLQGSEIDYQEDIEGERFIIRNPNAKTTCGCGSSFATE